MKNIVLIMSLLLVISFSFGQGFWGINFEDTSTIKRIWIDTIADSNNIWQIGKPNKVNFTSGYSPSNVIVTDTAYTYPVNDTSSFSIVHLASYGWENAYPWVNIGGWYYVNSDSLTDFGYLDFSPNHGINWYWADSSKGFCNWGGPEEIPVFTGNSNGWKHFNYCLQVPYAVSLDDTILYRFTFISDSIQTNKDGLMFDDLYFEDWIEGIQEFTNSNLISIYPNPANENISIEYLKSIDKKSIQVIDCNGQIIYQDSNFDGEIVSTKQFYNGIYILKYSDEHTFSIKKFIVQH